MKTAIPALLELLDLAGCIITIDAMGTQTAIATQIYNAKADYVRTPIPHFMDKLKIGLSNRSRI